MLELIVAIFILGSLILYALLGGADFGGGMWDWWATGPRAGPRRDAVARAIGPIWEANHVWLILVVVLLFTGFPRAFSAMMTSLNIPLTAMLIGIVLRGAAFMFRKYSPEKSRFRRLWGAMFGAASFFTPFCQGAILAALSTGQIRVIGGRVATGFFAGWLTHFAIACGIFALALFAFLSAVYLTIETQEQPELQDDFRKRAMWSEILLAPIAVAVFFTSKNDAPEMYAGLTQWWAPLLLIWTTVFALGAFVALWRRWFQFARVAAIGQVTVILIGWSLAQYPNFVAPDVTVANSAAPTITLRLLVIALTVGAIVLLPSLGFLFHIFKGRAAVEEE